MSIEEIKKDILIEANSFYDITTLKNKSVFEFNKYQLIAIIVNCAFSLELYFKYIYLCTYYEGRKQLIVNYTLLKDFIAYISEYANNV